MRGVPNGAVLADEEDKGIEDLPAGGVFDGMLGGTDDDNSTKRKRRSAVVRASAMAAFFERPVDGVAGCVHLEQQPPKTSNHQEDYPDNDE